MLSFGGVTINHQPNPYILLWISTAFRSFQEAPGERGMAAIAEHSTGAEAQLTKAAESGWQGGVRWVQLQLRALEEKYAEGHFLSIGMSYVIYICIYIYICMISCFS